MARAIDSRCFSPPDSLKPFSPIMVSYLLGNLFMNSSAKDSLAADLTSSSVAFELA